MKEACHRSAQSVTITETTPKASQTGGPRLRKTASRMQVAWKDPLPTVSMRTSSHTLSEGMTRERFSKDPRYPTFHRLQASHQLRLSHVMK